MYVCTMYVEVHVFMCLVLVMFFLCFLNAHMDMYGHMHRQMHNIVHEIPRAVCSLTVFSKDRYILPYAIHLLYIET